MDKRAYVAAAFAAALALGWWVVSSSSHEGDGRGASAVARTAVSGSSLAGANKGGGGVLAAEVDDANVVAAEFVKPGHKMEDLRDKAESEALDLEKSLEDGRGEWLELAVQLGDPRPLMDLDGRFACKRLLEESCALDIRLVIDPGGDVLYASGSTAQESRGNCDAYAACMTQHYTQRSFPHGNDEPLAVLLSRHTGEPDDAFFEDPVQIRSMISILSEDLAAAEELPEFDTPQFQLRYRLQRLSVEALEQAATALE